MNIHMYVHTYVCIYIYMYVHIYIYTHLIRVPPVVPKDHPEAGRAHGRVGQRRA